MEARQGYVNLWMSLVGFNSTHPFLASTMIRQLNPLVNSITHMNTE